jgi:hypothetical protein
MYTSNGPLRLNPLDTKVIYWDILKDVQFTKLPLL